MTNLMKKSFCFLMLIWLSAAAVAQSVSEQLVGHWQTDQLIGVFKGMPVNAQYTLTPPEYRGEHVYGNNLVLEKGGKFRSFYQAQCGVDCFGSASGDYRIIGRQMVIFTVRESRVFGMTCGDRSYDDRNVEIDMGLFVISKTGNGLTLTRVGSAQDAAKD